MNSHLCTRHSFPSSREKGDRRGERGHQPLRICAPSLRSIRFFAGACVQTLAKTKLTLKRRPKQSPTIIASCPPLGPKRRGTFSNLLPPSDSRPTVPPALPFSSTSLTSIGRSPPLPLPARDRGVRRVVALLRSYLYCIILLGALVHYMQTCR